MAITLNGSAGVTTNSGAVYDGISSGTAVTATGTNVDFTGIPSWVKRITVMFSGVSTSGTSNPQLQLGTSGGVVTSGYVATNATVSATVATGTATSGITVRSANATNDMTGTFVLTPVSGNLWIANYSLSNNAGANIYIGGGYVTLSGTLDRIRITTVNGTDTFDAGSINILYE